MPEFLNPFSGVVPRKLTKEELIRAIRLNISAEHEAVHLYMAHADATDDEFARKVLTDIANEEREHIGEFMELLRRLAPDEAEYLEAGRREVVEMAESGGEEAPAQ
jgi:rubrerythrin